MKTEFYCENCGYVSPRFYGKCPECGEWNSFVERNIEPVQKSKPKTDRKPSSQVSNNPKACRIADISALEKERIGTGISEFDRVLGGGIVAGSVVLLSGEPGIGKSTLLLQICRSIGIGSNVLYVTGEESPSQIKLRCRRLGVDAEKVYILSENSVDEIIGEINALNP